MASPGHVQLWQALIRRSAYVVLEAAIDFLIVRFSTREDNLIIREFADTRQVQCLTWQVGQVFHSVAGRLWSAAAWLACDFEQATILGTSLVLEERLFVHLATVPIIQINLRIFEHLHASCVRETENRVSKGV